MLSSQLGRNFSWMLTDIKDAVAAVLPAVADHKLVQITLEQPVVEDINVQRDV